MLGSHTALTPNLRELVRAHCGGRFIPAKRGNVLVRAARDGPFGKGSEVYSGRIVTSTAIGTRPKGLRRGTSCAAVRVLVDSPRSVLTPAAIRRNPNASV